MCNGHLISVGSNGVGELRLVIRVTIRFLRAVSEVKMWENYIGY